LSAKHRRLRNRSLRIGVVEKRLIPLFSFLWFFALRPFQESDKIEEQDD
jgi:hypothetical protein